jgi:hypothetical protein
VLDELIATVAQRYGFRPGDYTAVWDGLEFDPKRDPHELAVTVNDGRHIAITISETTLGNPWRPLRDIEAAFRELQRRAQVRGE